MNGRPDPDKDLNPVPRLRDIAAFAAVALAGAGAIVFAARAVLAWATGGAL